jgi:protoporphyrinogen oxidase
MPEVLIIGAGLTGLSCAYHLRRPFLVLEKGEKPGGLCGSVTKDGFTFDYTGHFLHLRDPYAEKLVKRLLKTNRKKIKRNAWIYAQDVFLRYPFQANLHALPERVRDECVDTFLHKPASAPGNDFYHWSLSTFGSGITRYFMKPYNEKLWTVPATKLTTEWEGPFVPKPSARDILQGAREQRDKDFGYNVFFHYPARGGSQSLIDVFARPVLPHVRCSCAAKSIDIARKTVTTGEGKTLSYDRLVSTQPLIELVRRIRTVPPAVARAAEKLSWNSVLCCNLGIRHASQERFAGGRHWIYFPDKEYSFYRVGVYSNVLPSLAPRGCASVYVEISYRPGKPPSPASALIDIEAQLRRCGVLTGADRIETVDMRPIPFAYVIYDRHRSGAVEVIQSFLKAHDIHSIGRYGAWEYSFMERSILDGKATAELLNGK